MRQLINSVGALTSLQEEIHYAVMEMIEAGITGLEFFDAEYPVHKGYQCSHSYVSSRQFPYLRTSGANVGDIEDYILFVKTDLPHVYVRSGLYSNERDRLLSTPSNVRKMAIRDMELEIGELEKRRGSADVVFNLSKSLKKLKASLDGTPQAIEIYPYHPASEKEQEGRISRRAAIHDMPLADLQRELKHNIAMAKSYVSMLGVENCFKVSQIFYGAGAPVVLETELGYFPLARTTKFTTTPSKPLFRQSLAIDNDNIRIIADVPFRKREALLSLPPDVKRQVLEEYKNSLEWFRKLPFRKQQEVFRNNRKLRMIQHFIGILEKELL